MDRRKLLTWAVRGTGAFVASVVVGPAIVTSLSPVLGSEESPLWSSIGQASSFPLGEIKKAESTNRDLSVYVWRKDDAEFVVYSRACTDLGCPVKYDSGSEWFFCPCHGGIFDKEGQRRAGPPPRPLWRYEYRLSAEGDLEIDLRSVPAPARGGA